VLDRPTRIGQVLERVPEDDGRPLARHVGDRQVEEVVPHRVSLDPRGLAAAGAERVDEDAVPRSDVEHRARRSQAVDACRQQPT